MGFREQVKFTMLAKRCGWYAIRQLMLAKGYTMEHVATVLANLLRLQGETKKV